MISVVFELIGGINPSAYNAQKFEQMIRSSGVIDQTGGQSMTDVVYPLLDSSYRQSACPSPPSSNDSIAWIRTVSEVNAKVLSVQSFAL